MRLPIINSRAIAMDLETCDPHLKTTGLSPYTATPLSKYPAGKAHYVNGQGHVAGVALSDGERNWYLPCGHDPETAHANGWSGEQYDPREIADWLRPMLLDDSIEWRFANCLYDLEWLFVTWELPIPARIFDVQFAEPLLDESRKSYSLNVLAELYLGDTKSDEELYQWLSDRFGGPATRAGQGGRIWQGPVDMVGEYAEQDAWLTWHIAKAQQPMIERQRLDTVCQLEHDLVPMLLHMRRQGVRVDIDRAEQMDIELTRTINQQQAMLDKLANRPVNVHASASIAPVFDAAGIEYPMTELGAPSFTQAFLRSTDLGRTIMDIRKSYKLRDTFIRGAIQRYQLDGVIRPRFHPLRSDDYGTVTGRFSSTSPNAQQIPSRDELAKEVRRLFVPHDAGDGQTYWYKFDESQVEFRLALHYAQGPEALELKRQFWTNPAVDYHQLVADLAGIDRKLAKGINFGLIYGMGAAKLAGTLGISEAEARKLVNRYHELVPFARDLITRTRRTAERRGYVRTILGRRRRFNLWQERGRGKKFQVFDRQTARELFGEYNIQRAFTYRALNSIVQGSAADILKYSMREVWRSLGDQAIPMLTVHDELDFSIRADDIETAREIKRCMECATSELELSVPLLCDVERGPNWGDLETV